LLLAFLPVLSLLMLLLFLLLFLSWRHWSGSRSRRHFYRLWSRLQICSAVWAETHRLSDFCAAFRTGWQHFHPFSLSSVFEGESI
jgi:hypothetical protein